MPVFYSEKKIYSEKNGELHYRRYWDGSWLVKIPEGLHHSGTYLEQMWKSVSKRYVKKEPAEVLILGSGAGSIIFSTLKLWPNAKIDAVDYDPLIVDIGTDKYGALQNKNIEIFISEAGEFVAKSEKRYDLILIDLFYKDETPPLLRKRDFLADLKMNINRNGTIIVNLGSMFRSKDKETLLAWQRAFPELHEIKYYGNELAVVKNRDIPLDYYNMHQSDDYAVSLRTNMKIIGATGSYYYVKHLPFNIGIVTAMHTDTEPNIEDIKREAGIKHGLIIWSPWRKSLAAKPWRRWMLPPLHVKGNGLSYVSDGYQERWSQAARRDLRKFEMSGKKIFSVKREDFVRELMLSSQKSFVKSMFNEMIRRLKNSQLSFWLVEKPDPPNSEKKGEILGGLAVMDYGNTSVHLAAFNSADKDDRSGTGLINHWYQYALKKGIKYLNFGHLRQSGEPKSWQGYSDFKRKFIDQEIIIENEYFRFF